MPDWLFWPLIVVGGASFLGCIIGCVIEDDILESIGGLIACVCLVILWIVPGKPAHADFWPAPTTVKDTGTVVINSHVGGSRVQYLIAAIRRVDTHTNTQMAMGPCRQNVRCITVRIGNVPGPETGRKSGSYFRTLITVEPTVTRRYLPYLFTHELGHAFTLNHSRSCVSVMSPYLTCHGRPTSVTFTPAQRTQLAKH